MDEETIIDNGCYEWVPADKDFSYEDIGSLSLSTLPEVKVSLPWFNQWNFKETKKACTIVNSTRALIWMIQVWYKETYTDEEVKSMIFESLNYCVQKWQYVIGSWWYVPTAMKYVCKWWNENNPNKQVSYVQIHYTSEDFAEILKRGYPLVGSYRGNTDYNLDYRKDCVLDWQTFPNPSYGHCTDWMFTDSSIVVNDSYIGTPYNTYKIKYPWELINNKVWNPNFYLWINNQEVKDNSEEIKRLTEYKSKLDKSIELDSWLYDNTKDPNTIERENFKNEMHLHAEILRKKRTKVIELLNSL